MCFWFSFYCQRLRDSFLRLLRGKSTGRGMPKGWGYFSAGLASNLWFMDFVKLHVIRAGFLYLLRLLANLLFWPVECGSINCQHIRGVCIRTREVGKWLACVLCVPEYLRRFALKLLFDAPVHCLFVYFSYFILFCCIFCNHKNISMCKFLSPSGKPTIKWKLYRRL